MNQINTSASDQAPNSSLALNKGRPLDLSGLPESGRVTAEEPEWLRLVGIRFSKTGRVTDYDAKEYSLRNGDAVVVDHPGQGLMIGWVSKPPLCIDNSGLKLRLKPILRKASDDDLSSFSNKAEKESRGLEVTQRAASRMGLPMKILRVEYTLDRRKATVYFSSENRVDFRELLKELIHDLKAKVELRQVGARDETKRLGAIGVCGEPVCCSRFLNRFHGVTIRMAKTQDLSLKPIKVTGMCGRLKCCLAYEDEVYRAESKTMPRVGSCVKCSNGCSGKITATNLLQRLVTVQMEDGTIHTEPVVKLLEIETMKQVVSDEDEGAENLDGNEWNQGGDEDERYTDVD